MLDQILQSYCLERMILKRSCYDTIPNYQEAKGGAKKASCGWRSIAIDTLNDR